MENSLNQQSNDMQSKTRIKRNKTNKKIIDVSDNVAALDEQLNATLTNKRVNIMARRYELAYTKLYSELPVWKQKSFVQAKKDDMLYKEFIANVIALAENENDNILLTA